jgi:hypothetical protein
MYKIDQLKANKQNVKSFPKTTLYQGLSVLNINQ